MSERPALGQARRNADKRERILRAAVKVFAKSGFHATRVSEIAEEAGVADGTIYLYFKSKEEVLTSLFEDRVDRLLSYLKDELPKLGSAPERLRRIIELQLGLIEGERELAEVITVILRQSTALVKQHASRKFTEYLDAIARVVSEGQAQGVFRSDVSPGVIARAIFGGLDGIVLTWALGNREKDDEQERERDRQKLVRAGNQFTDVVLRGLSSP